MGFSSLYTGATGVIAHGEQMQVVANNLANVSTHGYKRADMLFGDLMSQQLATGGSQSGSGAHSISQIGNGVGISDIRTIFQEGGLQGTNTTTDLAITGAGFFGVRKVEGASSGSGATHFTRAGAFRFDNEAYMVDPGGYRLQGFAVDRDSGQVASSVSDIQLPYEDIVVDGQEVRVVQSLPKMTSSMEIITTLDQKAPDTFTNDSSPFFAMSQAYDGLASDATARFGQDAPVYSSSLTVYDANGGSHDLTVYYDPINSGHISNGSPGYSYWEYVVAIPGGSDGSTFAGTSAAGLVGMGVMTYNGLGELVGHSAFERGTVSSGGGKDLATWVPATFNSNGRPQFNAIFASNGSAIGSAQSISLDFGIGSSSDSWQLSNASTAAGVGRSATALPVLADLERNVRASTSFDGGSSTLYSIQDGYGPGYLQYVSITREGFLRGHFTNGQSEDMYQVSLYKFNSEWGLKRDGSTNFVATEASGAAMAGTSEVGGRGTMQQNTLESSNVDMAQEFATMILTQRGYQSNTKVITTADSILNTLINTKR